MSIKESTDEWVRKGPTLAIAIIAAAGLLIGGLIGVGVGFKVEQSRTKSDVQKLKDQLKAKGGSSATTAALGQRSGKVTAKTANTIDLATKTRGAQVLTTNASTDFVKAVSGTIADVKSGRRILVTPGGAEIIVLATESELGRVVTAVASDSITIAEGSGSPGGKIDTADVHRVSIVKPATAADVTTGGALLAGGLATSDKNFDATEVIVLPADNAFTN
jgi:hypothetical protein